MMRKATGSLLLAFAVTGCEVDPGIGPDHYPNPEPNPPTITGLVAGNGQIAVSFTPGSANGSGSIIEHGATCKPASGNGNGNSGTSSPIVVSGLLNGTEYTCTAVAIASNPFAGSPAISKPSNAMTATPVAPPDA